MKDQPLILSNSNLNKSNKANQIKFKQLNRSSSLTTNLIERYRRRMEKSQREKEQKHNSLISRDNLNALLCKLKEYYNEIMTITQIKQHEINLLTEDNRDLQLKFKEATDFQPIELLEERISLNNFNGLKVTKEQLEGKLNSVLLEKKDLIEAYKKEEEYSKTLEYMDLQESDHLKQINDSIADTEAKLHTLNMFKKNIDKNIIEQKMKKNHYNDIISRLTDDIDLIDNVRIDQEKKNESLNESINKKEAMIANLRNEIKAKQKENEEYAIREKKYLKDKLEMVNEIIRNKKNKEQSYIRTIMCLNLIQKHFVEVEKFDLQSLIESNEYRDIVNNNVVVYLQKEREDLNDIENDKDNDKEIIFNSFSLFENTNTNHLYSNNTTNMAFDKAILKKRLMNDNKNTITNQFTLIENNSINMNMNKTQNIKTFKLKRQATNKAIERRSTIRFINFNNKEVMISLDQLKKKFDEIHMTRNDLFEYYYQIENKIAFLRNTLSHYNSKQIYFENKKNVYYAKVKEIISKDYWNFVELIKNNSRFEAFMNTNKEMIGDSKLKHEENKMYHIYRGYGYGYGCKDMNSPNDDNNANFKKVKCKDIEKEHHRQIERKLLRKTSLQENNSNNNIKSINDKSYNRSNSLSRSHISYSIIQKEVTVKPMKQLVKSLSFELFNTSHHLISEIKNCFEGIHSIIAAYKSYLIEDSYKYRIIERTMRKLTTLNATPFDIYVSNLINYIIINDDLETQVDQMAGSKGTIDKLKQELFYESNTDKPRIDYIKSLTVNNNINDQSILFNFLNDKRRTLKGLKALLSFSFELKSVDESAAFNPLTSFYKKESIMKELLYNKSAYSYKQKGIFKLKAPRKINETVINNDDSYYEKETTQTDNNKNTKKRNNSMDERVIKKLYEPSLAKTFYNRSLNDNMTVIKGMTRNYSRDNYALIRKKNEVNKISNSLLIYNNPKININELSNSSYNTIVKYIISNQVNHNWKTKSL